MIPKFFIGIDISKFTLDFAIYSQYKVLSQEKIENSKAAIKQFLLKLKSNYKCTSANSLLCAENMGIYATFLLKGCHAMKFRICMESALQIKKSLGIQRGKNDALDSVRIAQYASKNFKILKIWEPSRPVIEHLKELSSLRKRLVKTKGILTSLKKRQSYFLTKSYHQKLNSYCQPSVSVLKKDIGKIDQEIENIINQDERLNRLMQLITSVPRIGKVIATEIIICTNEFRSITSPKKLACYCGIAPFAWTSGTSIKGKARVSHHANKELKALLHIAALGIVRMKKYPSLRDYFDRKVAEGKNKMSVLNALRNKLVHRIFACVRDDKLFTEYQKPLAVPVAIDVS